MNERLLEIVFYLMDCLHDEHSPASNLSDASIDLKELGFSDEEISRAYSWILEHFQGSREHLFSAFPEHSGSMRVLTQAERTLLSPDAHAFLIRLFDSRLINGEQVEEVLERCAVFGRHPVTVEHLKLIISMVALSEHEGLDKSSLFDDDFEESASIN